MRMIMVLRWIALAAAALTIPAGPPPAAAQEKAAPPPPTVDVRARVMASGRFVGELTLDDFEVLEDGRPQAVRSLAQVRAGQVVRAEGADRPTLRLDRSYTLLFQAVDWDPKLTEVVQHLFGSVLKPGDTMTLVTPTKPYTLQKDALALRTRAELAQGMEEVLRKDILRGGGEYRDLIRDLRRLIRAISSETSTFGEDMESDITTDSTSGLGLETQIDRYRLIDETKLVAFADSLKRVPGQKTVVMFYQREYRPEISSGTMSRLMTLYQANPDILGNLMDLFQFYTREKRFDADRVKKAFADAGIDFHFIFMEKKSQRVFGATMREQSEDVYPGFVEIAAATGGTSASSANPAAAFMQAMAAAGDFYLLSYLAEGYVPDGRFRTVEVRVKRGSLQVASGLGYYAK
jgi:VWFA-related protein